MKQRWLLRNATLLNQDRCDLLLQDGAVSLVHADQVTSAEIEHWDLAGKLVLPGLVEMHVHLDKTYSPITNTDGTLRGAIESFKRTSLQRTFDSIERNANRAIEAALVHGVTKMRSHINLHCADDLAIVEMFQAIRARYRGQIDLQFVGMLPSDVGSEEQALLTRAVTKGIDLIGGAPALAVQPDVSIDATLRTAQRLGLPVDFHVDENLSPDSSVLAHLARSKTKLRFEQSVTASHCCSLACVSEEELSRTLEPVADAGIGVVALPACNLFLMGRDHWPKPRGTAPIGKLIEAGITVAAGSDNVQDPFNPFGNYDPLYSAHLAALVGQLGSCNELLDAFSWVTTNAAQLFDGGTATVCNGSTADLVVLDETDPLAAMASPPLRLATFKSGRLIVRSRLERLWPSDEV